MAKLSMEADAETEGLPHRPVCGVKIFDGDLDQAVSALVERHALGLGARVGTANVDFLSQAARDATLAADLASSTLVVADGAPVAWLARHAGARHARRVAGVDLVGRLCHRLAGRGARVVLYGSTLDVATATAAALERQNAGLSVRRVLCPPFRGLSASEELIERDAIAAAQPDLVLVALGCPRQERLIARYFDCAPSAIWIGVGGSFDFFAGRRRRAPALLQKLGLEWSFRLLQEPARLWKRYLLRDAPFLLRVVPGYLLLRAPQDAAPLSG